MSGEPKTRRWTATFERLPEGKRERVLGAARRAFSASGYAGANINGIASEAGISIGSLYKYFRTKEDLFLALIEEYHGLIERSIDDILSSYSGFFERVDALLVAAAESAARYPESVRIYLACGTEELAPLAARLSVNIEEVSATRYRAMVVEAQTRGEVDPSLDPGWAAFFLDDLFLMLQYSFGSEYYRERLRLFTGGHQELDTAVLRLRTFIERALRPR